jgi:hypothetical protein
MVEPVLQRYHLVALLLARLEHHNQMHPLGLPHTHHSYLQQLHSSEIRHPNPSMASAD